MKTVWINTGAWVAAVVVALTLAFASPTESTVMGKLLPLTAKRVDQQTVSLPAAFPSERTLVLIGFAKAHRPDVESWITGLRLDAGSNVPWIRMAVYQDPGDATRRVAIEEHLRLRYTNSPQKDHVLAVVTGERDALLRAVGVGGTEQMVALVLNRQGEVLARTTGAFDADKGEALRATLLENTL